MAVDPSRTALVEPRELAEAYIEIPRTGELDRLDEVLAEDVFDHVGQQSGIAWWKEILGRVGAGGGGSETVVEHRAVRDDLGRAKQVGAL